MAPHTRVSAMHKWCIDTLQAFCDDRQVLCRNLKCVDQFIDADILVWDLRYESSKQYFFIRIFIIFSIHLVLFCLSISRTEYLLWWWNWIWLFIQEVPGQSQFIVILLSITSKYRCCAVKATDIFFHLVDKTLQTSEIKMY